VILASALELSLRMSEATQAGQRRRPAGAAAVRLASAPWLGSALLRLSPSLRCARGGTAYRVERDPRVRTRDARAQSELIHHEGDTFAESTSRSSGSPNTRVDRVGWTVCKSYRVPLCSSLVLLMKLCVGQRRAVQCRDDDDEDLWRRR
jgi:hypothetical protein